MMICVICGSEFQPRNSRYITCSPKCSRERTRERSYEYHKANREQRNEYSRANRACHRKANPVTCVICGKAFYRASLRARTNTCSPECRRQQTIERQHAWYLANHDRIRERQRETGRVYRKTNAEQIKKRRLQKYLANHNQIKERMRIYREANRERMNEYGRAWYKTNLESIREYRRRYRKERQLAYAALRELGILPIRSKHHD